MTSPTNWQKKVAQEFTIARKARSQGNEGKARVCARRAAGFAVEAFFRRQGVDPSTHSAYALLELLHEKASLPTPIDRSLYLLTLRVTEDHELPEQADLIQESERLIRFLFPDQAGP